MNELGRALSLIKKYKPRKSSLPVLQNVHMELEDGVMTLTVTDLDVWATTSFPCIGNPFETTVDFTKLEKATEDMKDPLGFTVETKTTKEFKTVYDGNKHERKEFDLTISKLVVSDDGGKVTLATIPPEEFPPKPESGDLLGELDLEGVSRVIPFAATDEVRPVLTCVLLDAENRAAKLVAVDGFKLAILEKAAELPDTKLLLPADALNRLPKRYTQAKLFSGKEYTTLVFDGLTLTTKIPEGHYPDYNQIIPTSHNSKLEVGIKDWLDAVKAVKVFSDETNGIVRHSVTNNTMTVSAKDEEGNVIERTVKITVDQLSPLFAVNNDHLTAILKACSGKNATVKLSMNELPQTISEEIPNSPTTHPLVFEDGTNWKAVVMPMYIEGSW